MTTSSGRHEPTDEEIREWVADLLTAIRDGWTPSLETRLRFGLTAEWLQEIRGMPEEKDVCGAD